MRQEYEMSEEQLAKILDACKPVPAMFLSGGKPMFGTPQENANRAWQELATVMGFKWDTVRPIKYKDQRFFTAEPIG